MRWLLLLLLLAAPVRCQTEPGIAQVSIPSGEVILPGTLTLPVGVRPAAGWPLVVMVQGSGPSDRDETVGHVKLFADLASQLQALGVGTLRYDKRTWLIAHGRLHVSAEAIAHITLDQEVTDDAVAALAFAAAAPAVDRHRIVLLGHSLGGSLAPRIVAARLAAAPGSVRGIVELAAAALPASVLVPMQVAFQGSLAAMPRDQVIGNADAISAAFHDATSPRPQDPNQSSSAASILPVPAAYLRDWNLLDTARDLKALALPTLVLHGARDVQVSYQDYVLLALAATAPGSRALEFPTLGHLFTPVPAESTGTEFVSGEAHPPAAVAEAIAAWIPR